MNKRESGVQVGKEQKKKWSGVYVGAKVKREKKSVGHVRNGEKTLKTAAQNYRFSQYSLAVLYV